MQAYGRKHVFKMPYIKRFTQQRMSFADLLTLQELPDLLECVPYVENHPVKPGAK